MAALVMGASPAFASWSGSVTTTDSHDGGYAHYEASNKTVAVCDHSSDGMRAVARIGSAPWFADANGNNNVCVSKKFDLTKDMNYKLEVCLQDGASGPRKYCNSTWVEF
ncbi:hypothetical protein ABT298_20140 [Streptomyces sp. NPDC001034]|uniref:hypothetical protein n=1 Tax=Streptomyces sp. NPDC001034 TaxID=3154375 RepID=UPI0033300E9C